MSYRQLEIWIIAREVALDVHCMTLSKLPRFELHEMGSQIRRSAQSVRSNIVEGYGRRRYKADFVKHLIYAQASCDETADHLGALYDSASLKDEELFTSLSRRIDELGRKLNLFLQAVERGHRSAQIPRAVPASSIQHPASRPSRAGAAR